MVGLGDSDYNDYVYDGLVGYNVRSLIALEQNPKPVGLSESRHYYNHNFRILTSPDANAYYEYVGSEWATGYNSLGYCHRTN